MITAIRVKSEFKLNESDLSVLNVLRVPNPHYRNQADMRLYSFMQVMQVSRAKKAAREAALEEAEQKQQERRGRLIVPLVDPKETRRMALIDALHTFGLELDNHISNTLYIQQTKFPRLMLHEAVHRALRRHLVDHRLPIKRMREFVGVIQTENEMLREWYGNGNFVIQDEALEALRILEEQLDGEAPEGEICKCGRRKMHDKVFGAWCRMRNF